MQKAITVRHKEEIMNMFMGLTALNGVSANDVLRQCIEEYVEHNRKDALMKLSGEKQGTEKADAGTNTAVKKR